MDRSLERLVTAIRSAADDAGLQQTLVEALHQLGVSTYNYGAGRLNPGEGPVVERYWTNMAPEWLQRYVARGYQRTDRLVAAGLTRVTPFFFSDVFSTPPELPEQQEMETMFPFMNGVVVPIHSPFGRFGILSAASGLPDAEWQAGRIRAMADISLVALSVHQRSEELSAEARLGGVVLSPREREALKWAAYGKTSEEIALIMGISERTVRKHVGTAMERLNVSSRVQAVAQALAAGLVHI